MRKYNYYGEYKNDDYFVGCNGRVHIFDSERNKKLKVFTNISWAYSGAFKPDSNIFAAKSTGGILAVYDLDRMKPIKKITLEFDAAQDYGFAFSPDGKFFYDIELKEDVNTGFPYSQLTVYETDNFTKVTELFMDGNSQIYEMEFDETTGECYILGKYGIGKLYNNKINDIKDISIDIIDEVRKYYSWKRHGFTEESIGLCTSKTGILNVRKINPTLRQVYEGKYTVVGIKEDYHKELTYSGELMEEVGLFEEILEKFKEKGFDGDIDDCTEIKDSVNKLRKMLNY